MGAILLEGLYIMAGLLSLVTAFMAFKDSKHPTRMGTTLFWALLALVFIVGKYVPAQLIGAVLIVMGFLTATKQVNFGSQKNAEESVREERSKQFGNKLFVPAMSIAIIAFAVAQFTPLSGLVGLGFG